MLPLKGIYSDNDISKTPEGFAFDILNGVIYKSNIINEEGTKKYSSSLNDLGLQPNGFLAIDDNRIIFTAIKSTGSVIGIIEVDGSFTIRLEENLGFDVNYPNDIEAQYNQKKELVIAITDGLNTPKVINLDNLPNPFNINSIEMFPYVNFVNFDSEIVEGGGSLKAGAYQFAISYEDLDGTTSEATNISNPIFITNAIESNYNNFSGIEPGSNTNKGIKMTFTNVDTNYRKLRILMLSKINQEINTVLINEVDINTSTVIYTITGTEAYTNVTFEEVISPKVHYKTIKHLTQVDGTLYGASVTEEELVNFQKYANLFKLKWTSSIFDFKIYSYKTNKLRFYNRTFKHGEIYAFYVRFKIKSLGWSRAFHIPGKKADNIVGNVTEESTVNDLISSGIVSYKDRLVAPLIDAGGTNKVYQIVDTSTVTSNPSPFPINEDIGSRAGSFGTWINQDEVYPNIDDFNSVNGSEDLRGQKVRHHKFPSTSRMRDVYSSYPSYGLDIKDVLGVIIDFPTLPSDVLDKIEGYEILYAERNDSNTTELGEGMLECFSQFFAGNGTVQPDYAPGFQGDTSYVNRLNYNGLPNTISSRETDLDFKTEFRPLADDTRLRLYSPDMLFSKSSSFPTTIETLYNIEVPNAINNVIGIVTKPFTTAINDEIRGVDGRISTNINTTREIIRDKYGTVTSMFYIPQNVIYNNINNTFSEEFIYLDSNKTGLFKVNNNFDLPNNIVDLRIIRNNIANSFYNQKMVSTGKVHLPATSQAFVFGGDAFINFFFFITHSNRIPIGNYRNRIDLTRIRVARDFLVESKININFRYEIKEDSGSIFAPKTPITGISSWFMNYMDEVTYNRIGYSLDYNGVNNTNSIQVYGSSNEENFVSEDEFKIVRSNIRKGEEKNPSWRRFGANDYYIIPRDKGAIINIQGYGNNLMINTKQSFFVSLSNEELTVENTTANIGRGDIFGRSFREVILDQLGYSGCSHKYSCLLTPLGYFFIDVVKRKSFLYDGQTVKDINSGSDLFFRDKYTNEIDNPFLNKGYSTGWDEKYSRLMLSKVSGDMFTRSYYPATESWVSRHEYYPKCFISTRSNLYGLDSTNNLHQFNNENYGIYFENPSKDFHIVGVLNGYPSEAILNNLKWNTVANLNEDLKIDITFDEIMIWNREQSTGNIEILPFDKSKSLSQNYLSVNTRKFKQYWSFNKFRDAVINRELPSVVNFFEVPQNINKNKSITDKKRLVDLYFVYKLLFKNKKISKLNEEISVKLEVIDIKSDSNLIGE